MHGLKVPVLRQVVWVGDSKTRLLDFPASARKTIGDELQFMQYGEIPKDVKPFKGVGSGVFEIAIEYDKNAYRTVVAVQLGEKIYVLHAFQKKSTHGIETPKRHVDLIKQRYAKAKEHAENERQSNTH